MNKKNAIKILQKHLDEIQNLTNLPESRIWKTKTLDSIAAFLGEDSELYKRFKLKIFLSKQVDVTGEANSLQQFFGDNPITPEYVFDATKKEIAEVI